MKFTFRNEKADIWHPKPVVTIKLKRVEVGTIKQNGRLPAPGEPFRIRLRILKTAVLTDDNPNDPYIWITLKVTFTSIPEAETWLNDNIKTLTDKYTLYKGD